MTTEAERIAKGLSVPQRVAMHSLRNLNECGWGTAVALRKLRLVTFNPMEFTDLGRSVAAALRDRENRDEG